MIPGLDIALGIISKGLTEKVVTKAAKTTDKPQKGPDYDEIQRKIHEDTKRAKTESTKLDRSIEAFFIGPRGENIDYFRSLIMKSIDTHLAARVQYEIEDARHITRRMKNEPAFLDAQDRLDRALNTVLTKMKDLTPPFFGSRYFGHMIWETTIPSIVGNFATLLYNPNNCAYEASPYTTLLEIEVMKEFAKMFSYPPFLGFGDNTQVTGNSWGHLTCGGTIANCQAFWAARNCRFLSLSIRKYIEKLPAGKIQEIEAVLANGSKKRLLDLNAWELFNISNDETMKLYDLAFETIYGAEGQTAENYAIFQSGVAEFSIGKAGLSYMYDWLRDINKKTPVPEWTDGHIPRPKIFVSATAHYSIRKSLSILGFGESSVEKVVVDLDSRICQKALKGHLSDCLAKKIPVLGVVGIVGSTEESTVDDLEGILALKKEFADQNLFFHFHIDGAYGGYFVAMTKDRQPGHWNSYSQFVERQLLSFCKADSITFDPHKTGYVPYACGGIIYRNHRLRDNLSFSAPYIYTGAEPNMAIYGIEGSKPGSSVTSVYLSLQVLPLVRGGHGELLERTMLNTKIFTASLYRVKEIDVEYLYGNNQKLTERFECLMLPRLYCEKENKPELKEAEMAAIVKISETGPTELEGLVTGSQDPNFQNFYHCLGPDLNIVCYGLNFIDQATGKFNTSLKKYNEFNKALIKLSKPVGTDISVRMKDLYVSQTEISAHVYGQEVFDDYLTRNGLINDGADDFVLIRSTIMNAFFTEQAEPLANNERVWSSNKVFIRELVQNGCETLLYLGWRGQEQTK